MELEYNHLVNGSYENHIISGKFNSEFDKIIFSFESTNNLTISDAKNNAMSILLNLSNEISKALEKIQNLKV